MEKYVILGRIGEGAHGIVFKAKSIETGALVALKKVALRRLEDGIPNTALREIKALQEIAESPYIVHLREVGWQFFFVRDGVNTERTIIQPPMVSSWSSCPPNFKMG